MMSRREVSEVRRPRGPWLTLREAERYARVQHDTILEAARGGEIACYRRAASTAVLVHVASVDGWIREHWTTIKDRPTDIKRDGHCRGDEPDANKQYNSDGGRPLEAEFDGRVYTRDKAKGTDHDGGNA